MNEKLKHFRLSLLAALALGACSAEPVEGPPLQGARIGGPFALTDQDGRRVRDTDFAGKYRLVYFGYTYCPDICPLDVQRIAKGLRSFERSDPGAGAKVQPIFITVDPERDTPAALKQFVAAFHPRMVGLTGSDEEIASVAKAYGVHYARQGGEGAKNYLMDHARLAFLLGPKGEPIALVPQESADAVAAELERWVT